MLRKFLKDFIAELFIVEKYEKKLEENWIPKF